MYEKTVHSGNRYSRQEVAELLGISIPEVVRIGMNGLFGKVDFQGCYGEEGVIEVARRLGVKLMRKS